MSMGSQEREALQLLGYLYLQHQRPAEALTIFKALATLFPEDRAIRRSLAYAQLRTDQPRAALASLERLPLEDHGTPALILLRSQALWRLGRVDEARHWLQRFLQERDGSSPTKP